RWQQQDEVVLLDGTRELLCRTACAWADIPLSAAQAQQRTREIAAMLDGAAAVGAKAARGLLLRRRTERWGQHIIEQIRVGKLLPAAGTPAEAIAHHRDLDGRLLSVETAAVELINILRPIVAVGRFITYGALALHEYPAARARLSDGDEQALYEFSQEVRRFYPFFPAIGGRVREPFYWHGHDFEPGDWVLLDLYGTNHDARAWDRPAAFRPQRFADGDQHDYHFIPQG